MGTRSLAYVIDEKKNILATIYRQYDGYPEGMGYDLYNVLAGRKLCNGFTSDTDYKEYSNGIGDLAAYIVHVLKDVCPIGTVYLYPPPKESLSKSKELTDKDFAVLNKHCNNCWGEYTYIVTVDDNNKDTLRIIIFDGVGKIFDGKPDWMADKFKFYKDESDAT